MIEKPVENGQIVKIGKARIFKDEEEKRCKYIVELYEGTKNGVDKFAFCDGYSKLIDAVYNALRAQNN